MPLRAWIAFLKLYQACFVNVKRGSEQFRANFLEYVYYTESGLNWIVTRLLPSDRGIYKQSSYWRIYGVTIVWLSSGWTRFIGSLATAKGRASLLLLCAMCLFTVIIVTLFVSFFFLFSFYMLYVPKAAYTSVFPFREASLLAACVL